jgi:hypothetical protein
MVLFEWPHSDASCIQIGFLVLRTRLVTPADAPERKPTLGDQLLFNDRFRHVRADYEGWWGTASDLSRARAAIGDLRLHDTPALRGIWAQLLDRSATTDQSEESETWAMELFEGWSSLLQLPVVATDGRTYRVMPDDWHDGARQTLLGRVCTQPGGDEYPKSWLAYPDHRAFTWSGVILNESGESSPGLQHAEHCEAWRMLLNADVGESSNDTSPPRAFDVEWTRTRTYYRWAASGTYYGVCTHAGAMLIRRHGGSAVSHLAAIFNGLYLDMQLLLLYDRSVAFCLSASLARRARDRREKRGNPVELLGETELRSLLDYFSNVYRFPLISNQQQALELYALARRGLEIDTLIAEVETKIRATDEMLRSNEALGAAEERASEARRAAEESLRASEKQVALSHLGTRLAIVGTLLGSAALAIPLANTLVDGAFSLLTLRFCGGGPRCFVPRLPIVAIVSVAILFAILRLLHSKKNPFLLMSINLGTRLGRIIEEKEVRDRAVAGASEITPRVQVQGSSPPERQPSQ